MGCRDRGDEQIPATRPGATAGGENQRNELAVQAARADGER